jgi:hypothetical protein
MKITTAWTDNGDGDGYCLLSAYSEHDFDNWGTVPEWHKQAIEPQDDPVRELVIEIPDTALAALFGTPTVAGTATPVEV